MTLIRNLEVVASDAEHPGLLTVGVMVDGAFITLAAIKTGQVEQMKAVPTALEAAAADNSTPPTSDTPEA